MVPGIQQISLSEEALKSLPIPVPPLTPPYGNVNENSLDSLIPPPPILGVSPESIFPIKVDILPNKGRSYVATRRIQPNELVFVAESFGTTMCDPWLDCGVCHYCWTTIQDRKAQIRLPRTDTSHIQGKGSKKKQETIMVFCDEKCLLLYGPELAETTCRVEQKIRRTWDTSSQRKPNLSTIVRSTPTISTDLSISTTTTTLAPKNTHYSIFVQQALSIAKTSKDALELSDQDLSCFLNNVWNALDAIVDEQELLLFDSAATTADLTNSHDSKNSSLKKKKQYTQKRIEQLYPNLAVYLLEGYKNGNATVATKMADDDCEIARLISEVLYRRQEDMRDISLSSIPAPVDTTTTNTTAVGNCSNSTIPGEQATFADYCAMQSNELVVFRQNLISDMNEFEQSQENDQEQEQKEKGDNENNNSADHKNLWLELLSILPVHLLGCIYIYLRLRDAYLLLNREEIQNEDSTIAAKNQHSLYVDNNLFRTIVYSEIANSFGIRDSSDELLGFAVFPRACFFNHSCRPNVEKKRRQGYKARQMEYWSTCVIEEGEECCISYGDISTELTERQSRLEDMYFFKCSCIRCLEEERDVK